MTKVTLAIENISELITVAGENAPRMGKAQGEIEKIKDGVVLVSGDKILYAGNKENAPKYEKSDDFVLIDGTGKTVTPGLIDSHTHLVHGGSRENELDMKLNGVTYLEILERGGGIMSTLKQTKEMSEDELFEQAKKSVERLIS